MIGSIRDTRALFSTLSIERAWNAVQVYSSFQRSRRNRNAAIKGLPIAMAIEPTTSCNLRCPECPSGLRSFTRPTGMLSSALFENTIGQLAETLSYLTFYFQGEPFLHPTFLDMVNYATERKIYTATSTNGHYLKEEQAFKTVRSGLQRLIISIDGTTQDTYQSYRIGGDLSKVLEGARNVVNAKRELKSLTPHIVFQFLVVKPNEHQIPDVKRMAREIGVDQVVLKTAQIYDYENGSSLMPENPVYSRYQKNSDGRYQIKGKFSNHCWKMWSSCVLTWDGKVVPCCFDKDAKHVLGDMSQQSFHDIWFGERYNHFRNSLFRSRKEIDICANCTEGTNVWA